jgi:glycosyltransferase involved in cell wall biosynthesis
VLLDLLAGLERYEHERVHLSRSRMPLTAAPSIVAGVARLRRHAAKFDLVHVMGDTAAMICLGELSRNRSVFGTHGLHFLRRAEGRRGALVRRRLSRVVGAADRTICSSLAERDELARLALSEDAARLVHVPNGIRLPAVPTAAERAEARAALGLSDDDVVALYLGQLEPRKHPLTAVEAARLLAARGLPIVLLVAGEGPLAGEVQKRAGAAVRALGFRDDPERLLRAADVFLMPSEREGLSLAVLEAMGHGLATVVSDGAGNPEAVGDAGIITPVGDPEPLANALTGLVRSSDERARLGAAARERVRERYSVERFLGDMDALLSDVLAGVPPARAPARAAAGARA